MSKKLLMILSVASLGLLYSGVVTADCFETCQDKFDACRHEADIKYKLCQKKCLGRANEHICLHNCSVQGGHDAAVCNEDNEHCFKACPKS